LVSHFNNRLLIPPNAQIVGRNDVDIARQSGLFGLDISPCTTCCCKSLYDVLQSINY
jgi:hypothetical protein